MNLLDQLQNVDMPKIANASFGVIDRLQIEKPGVQVQAMGVLFLLLCDEYGLDVRRVLETCDRVRYDADHKQRHEVGAIRQYIREELK